MMGIIRRYQHYLDRKAKADRWRAFLSLLQEGSGGTLLDCGCNDGKNTMRIADYIAADRVYGIDIVGEVLEEARKSGIIGIQSDLNEKFPLNDEIADVVFSNQVIEHLTNTFNFVKEVFRVLKPGGYAVISTNNLAAWHNIIALLLGWQPFDSKMGVGNPLQFVGLEAPLDARFVIPPAETQRGYRYGTHNKVLAHRALKEIFVSSGFTVEKIRGSGYYPFPSVLADMFQRTDPSHAVFLTIKARRPKI